MWMATFICCVDNRHMSTSVVRTLHHTTVATEKEHWWVLKSLLSTVLVLCSDLLQAVPRSLRWVTC